MARSPGQKRRLSTTRPGAAPGGAAAEGPPARARGGAPAAEPGLLTGWRAAGLYFLLALVYFFPALLPDRHVFGTDYLAAAYHYHEWISGLFAEGSIPKWLPYVYGGLPWFANPGMTWYPFRFLADWLLPASKIFPAIYVIQATVAGVGTYFLARELGARRWVAFVAGLAFQFTGQLMSFVYAGHDGRMIGMSSGPLFLFFLARGIRTGRVADFGGAAAAIGLAMLSFQIQVAYYLLLAGVLWAVFLLVSEGWARRPGPLARRIALGLGAVAFAFVLNAVNFLPFLDYVDASPRGGEGRGYDYAVRYSMAPEHVAALAAPEQAGILEEYDRRVARIVAAGRELEGENPFKLHTEYVGALVLVLLAAGVVHSRRDRRWWFFLALALFAFSLAFGGNTPLYRLYYALLPGTRMFRTPDMAYVLVPMAFAAMAALTLERLAGWREERVAGAGRRRGGTSGGSGGVAPAVWAGAAVAGLALFLGATWGNAQFAAAGAAAGWFRFAVFAALVTTTLWLWLGGRAGGRATAVALALLTVVDLWVIDRKFFETGPPPDVMFAPDDVVDFLRVQEGPFRVWVLPGAYLGLPTYRRQDNYLMRWGIEQASGEHGNQLQRWNEYLGPGEQVYTDYHNFLNELVAAAREGRPTLYIGAGNVRYVISMGQLPIPGWRLVHGGPGALVYENPDAVPRAFLVPRAEVVAEPEGALERMREPGWDPRETAFVYEPLPGFPEAAAEGSLERTPEVVEHRQDRVVVRAAVDRPALLVLADNWYPGWQARVDGRAAAIHRVNHTFRGVVLEAGTHEVEFRFRPRRLYLGLALYLTALALLLALAGWAAWRARGRGVAAGSAA